MQVIIEKVTKIKSSLSSCFFEREEVINGLLVALIARENLLMIGPPGAAKSAAARRLLKEHLSGVNTFEKAFTKTTKPEEVVGPMSLKGLEQERYYHVTRGYLPEAHVALLDEIFKCNSSVLHLMLPMANSGERLFQQEGRDNPTPLFSLVGTSNEYPEEDEGLEAFYNRFILRYEVPYIQETGSFVKMLELQLFASEDLPKITLEELLSLQKACCEISIENEVKESLVKIWQHLMSEGIRPSDRQYRDSLKLIKATALLQGRNQTEPGDLDILRHSLWSRPEERQTIAAIVKQYSADIILTKIEQTFGNAVEIHKNAMAEASPDAGTEAVKKLKTILGQLKKIADENPSKKLVADQAVAKINDLNKEVLATCLGLEL